MRGAGGDSYMFYSGLSHQGKMRIWQFSFILRISQPAPRPVDWRSEIILTPGLGVQ